MAYLPDARRVLVIGGGDGGTVTQLAKHPNLREIVWIEIDEAVIHLTVSILHGLKMPRHATCTSSFRAEPAVSDAPNAPRSHHAASSLRLG